MYSEILEELISMALEDGTLTEQTRNVIVRRAEKEGEDPEEVIMVVESRLRKLRTGSSNADDSLVISQEDEDENKNDDIDDFDIDEENKGVYVPSDVISKVLEMVKKYNENAFQWGYSILVYDDESQMLSGSFEEKKEAKGFLKEAKEAYRNGYMKEDYEKILKMCGY